MGWGWERGQGRKGWFEVTVSNYVRNTHHLLSD